MQVLKFLKKKLEQTIWIIFKICKKIKNYSKNFPMTVVQKKLSLKTFNDWKKI